MSSGHFLIEQPRRSPLRDTIRAVRWGNALSYVPTHCVNREETVRFLASWRRREPPYGKQQGRAGAQIGEGRKREAVFRLDQGEGQKKWDTTVSQPC